MPELPEVEFARRCWQRWAVGRRVSAVRVMATRLVRPASPRDLQVLQGATVMRADRRGKNLLVTAQVGQKPLGLWSHLGMTGKWLRRKAGDPDPPHARLVLALDDGHVLHDCDMRMFGHVRLVPGARFDEVPELAALGPDPLVDGIDPGALHQQLARGKSPIKMALLDQRLLAGVGNIQASEGLFRARLDPRRPAMSLSLAEAKKLAAGLLASIEATLATFARTFRTRDVGYVEERGSENPFQVYGRAGERCPRCRRAEITRIVQAQRSTFFCPHCQGGENVAVSPTSARKPPRAPSGRPRHAPGG